jgi:ketosteroid isomerase-like protein
MSEREPLEVVRALMGALRKADVEAATEHFAADATWLGSIGGLEPGMARGRDAVGRAFRDYLSTWRGLSFEGDDIRAAGDRVLVLIREHARGSGSGAPVEGRTAAIFRVEEGRITQVVSYMDRERAQADFEAGIMPASLD